MHVAAFACMICARRERRTLFYIYGAAGVRFMDAGVRARPELLIIIYLHMEIASFSASFLLAHKESTLIELHNL